MIFQLILKVIVVELRIFQCKQQNKHLNDSGGSLTIRLQYQMVIKCSKKP